jgi:hypothetical protein
LQWGKRCGPQVKKGILFFRITEFAFLQTE